jgi:hypothetical protein
MQEKNPTTTAKTSQPKSLSQRLNEPTKTNEPNKTQTKSLSQTKPKQPNKLQDNGQALASFDPTRRGQGAKTLNVLGAKRRENSGSFKR